MTIDEFGKTFSKQALGVAINNALGEELVNELDAAGCELVIYDELERYEFTNITAELQVKVDSKKR
jgi:hypothetical protein